MYSPINPIIINDIEYETIKKGANAWHLSYDVLCRVIRSKKPGYTPSDGRKVTIEYDEYPIVYITPRKDL